VKRVNGLLNDGRRRRPAESHCPTSDLDGDREDEAGECPECAVCADIEPLVSYPATSFMVSAPNRAGVMVRSPPVAGTAVQMTMVRFGPVAQHDVA